MSTMQLDHIKPIQELKKLLEKLIADGNMTDVSRREFENAVRQIMHVSNLQPLPPCVNSFKRAFWTQLDEDNWQRDISCNADYNQIYLPQEIWRRLKSDGLVHASETSHSETSHGKVVVAATVSATVSDTVSATVSVNVSANVCGGERIKQTKITSFFHFK